MISDDSFQKKQLVAFARAEGSLKLKGNPKKGGPEIEKFLSPLREELGKSDSRYLDITFGADWCAAFVYYLVVKAGYNLNIKPFENKSGTFGLVGIWFEWSVLEGKFQQRSYNPEPGDLILYDKLLSNSELDHIGIVLENKSNYFITAEGNVNNMTGIFMRENTNKIRGYVRL
jgi:hypothetical protein